MPLRGHATRPGRELRLDALGELSQPRGGRCSYLTEGKVFAEDGGASSAARQDSGWWGG